MARTPRKTEKSVDYHSSMASPNHNTAGKERGENSGMTRSTSQEINKEPRKKDGGSGEGVPKPKQTLRLILGPKPTPEAEAAAAAAFLEAERPRRSSSRLSSHDCAPATPTLSVAQTREVTRKAKAKGKDTLIRKVFHNPDGSLRGAKSDVPSGTPSVVQARRPVQGQGQVPAQPQVRHSAQGQAQVPAKNGAAVEEAQNTSKVDKPSRVKPGEGGQSKNDDWRRKARGGVTLENAVEVKENAPVLINCGAYPGAIANSDILPRDGGRGEPPKQKLPPVFNFEHKPFRSSSGSTASSNFSNAHPGSSIQHRDMRENAIEIFEDGPVPHGYGAGHPKSMVDPQLLAFDDVRSGRVPPIEDQIWFMQSPFRTTPLFESDENTACDYSSQTVTYFASSKDKDLVEVEPAGNTLDVTMRMAQAGLTSSKRKRRIDCSKPRKGMKLMSREKRANLLNAKSSGMDRGNSFSGNENELDAGETTIDDDSEATVTADEEEMRALSPRFL